MEEFSCAETSYSNICFSEKKKLKLLKHYNSQQTLQNFWWKNGELFFEREEVVNRFGHHISHVHKWFLTNGKSFAEFLLKEQTKKTATTTVQGKFVL